MTGPGNETLTAALRRLADEHASGLLSIATPERDVVLELADGIPVGIGPTRDASSRVGRDASAELVAAAVVDTLVNRTVAAIVGGGGDWAWDVASDAAMMPVPPGLATELSRRAVDAAQALAGLDPQQVLMPGRDLATHGEVDRVRRLFDGERTLVDVADEAGLTVPATATLAAALVAAGVLSTGVEDAGPMSWTDAVAGAGDDTDEDEDEPELWVMDPPEDDEDEAGADEDEEEVLTDAAASVPTEEPQPEPQPEPEPQWQQPAEPTEDAVMPRPAAAAPSHEARGGADDDAWSDTTWLDELDGAGERPAEQHARDAGGPGEATEESRANRSDARAALSAMMRDLQEPQRRPSTSASSSSPSPEHPPAPQEDTDGADEDTDGADEDTGDADHSASAGSSEAGRKQPKAAPGEVAEFLRELSRLALDDE